jgi:hypothetical protein
MKITRRQNFTNLLVAVLAAGFLTACGKKTDLPPPAVNVSNLPAPVAISNPGFDKLQGKWLRPDGGYILEIRSATAEGKLEAGYFNPKPIHVATAEASREGETVKVFIELRDVNYPGSTYTLSYQPATDRMTGNYFQAALGQNFEVEFVRQP